MNLRSKAVGLTALLLASFIGAACGSAGRTSSSVQGKPLQGKAAQLPAARMGGTSDLAAQVPLAGPRIVKTATLTLEVGKGAFDRAFQQATLVAGGHGGYVSTSQISHDRERSGLLMVRVPAAQFEATLGELRGLGRLKEEQVSGEDVTSQFVDLQARLRNWRAQESVLLRLMAGSRSIDDSLKVQGQLQAVQLQIEEITGQLRQLSNQSDLATISLSIREAPLVGAKPGLTFALAWKRGLHGLRVTAARLLVGLGYIAPFALIGLAALLGWAGVRRVRRPTPSA